MILRLLLALGIVSHITTLSTISRVFNAISQSRNLGQTFADVFQEVVGGQPSQRLRSVRQQNRLQPLVSSVVPFPCKTEGFRSPTLPTSVHKLQPGDIDVVGAIGDSLTAGNGASASNLMQVLLENRGMSFTGGGQGTWRKYVTLPNILKEFNPKLFGYSLGDGFWHTRNSQFNVAFNGATDEDLLFQAKYLVRRMSADKRVDLKKHWKLITILTGDNDFCTDMCYIKSPSLGPERHKQHLQEALDYLHQNLPRTFVNLISLPNILVLKALNGRPPHCELLKYLTCSCIFGVEGQRRSQELHSIVKKYHDAEKEVVNGGRYDTTDDFAVVVQPFTTKLSLAVESRETGNVTDMSYFSHDCFHYSQKGYARAANGLWNNMLQPVGMKSKNWPIFLTEFSCPTKDTPFLFTTKNSREFILTGKQSN